MYYYEQNWKVYRDIALEEDVIQSYSFIHITDSKDSIDIILITEFRDFEQYNNLEENFKKIMTKQRPNGPILMNDKQSGEFRKIIYGSTGDSY